VPSAGFGEDPADDRPPLPPADRLWRHPSEVGVAGNTGPRVVLRRQPSLRRVVGAGGLGLVAGGLVLAGALSLLGAFDTPVPPTAVERLAAAPAKNSGSSLAVADDALPAVAQVVATGPDGQRLATAAVVRNDGRVLTTSDAVDGASEIAVALSDGSVHDATLLGRDRRHDVGVLGIEVDDVPVVTARDTRLDQVVAFGDPVVVVDATPATDTDRGPLLGQGVVSGPSTTLTPDTAGDPSAAPAAAGRFGPMYGMVRITLPPRTPRPGPGAVVLDRTGALVGVITARGVGLASPPEGGSVPVVVWAIPFDHIRRVYLEVLDSGRYVPADLGVGVETVTDSDSAGRSNGTTLEPAGGVVVRAARGPGGGDNLQDGDVITHIGNTPVLDVNDARTEVRRYTPGEALDLTVVRDGTTAQLRTVLVSDNSVP